MLGMADVMLLLEVMGLGDVEKRMEWYLRR